MRVSLQLPTGTSLEYNVSEECSLVDLQTLIQNTEGVPPEMQQFGNLKNKPTDVHKQPLKEIFAESCVDGELKLNLSTVH